VTFTMTIATPHGKGPFWKISMLLGGCVAAAALAFLAVAVRVATTRGADAQAASGMYAFGDSLLFVAVFGTVGLLPTGLGLIFLRPFRLFWLILSAGAVVIATTGVTALALFAVGRAATTSSSLSSWAALAVLRILPAPLFAVVFLIAGVISPQSATRRMLLAASGIELIVTGYAGFVWLYPLLLR
jgi:hypothetical protein